MMIIRYWRTLSVSAKISVGFATVLLLHISIAVMGHYGLEKASLDRQDQERFRAQVESFYEIDRLVGEMQRHVLLFAYGGFKGPETRAIELQNELGERLDAANRIASVEHQEVLQKMQRHLSIHKEIFLDVIADRAKRRELVDQQLIKSAVLFDQTVEQLVASQEFEEAKFKAVSDAFHSAQLHAMRFVHSPDSAHVRSAQQDLASTTSEIERLQLDASMVDAQVDLLQKLVDDYSANFIQMVQATRGYLHLTNVVLAGQSQELFYLATKIRQDYSQSAEALSASMARDSQRFSTASSLFSLLTIVLGIAASRIIQKSISPPLKRITATIHGLAQGQKFEQIPDGDRSDELGKLAAAAQVFSEKAAETERLLEEVNYMRDQERNHAHSQKLEALGQLAAGIAHEINTPLQCVASNVEFLEESYDLLTSVIDDCCHLLEFELSEDQVDRQTVQETIASRRFTLMKSQSPEAASEAAEAVRRVVEIISAMKALSHPGSNEHMPADVNELVRNAATLSKHRWKDYAELTLELDDDLPMVPAHQAEISQVLINLLVNAGDALSEKEDHRGAITIRTSKQTSGVQLEVIDNGSGIPEEYISKIFDPFFTTKQVGKGTGQGLSLAYDVMVRRHHGEIDVTSGADGTTFRLLLPLSQEASYC